jgi:hypothetical protein
MCESGHLQNPKSSTTYIRKDSDKMDVREQLQRAKAQLEYVRSVLNKGGLEQWEAKEYATLEGLYLTEITVLESHISDNPAVFA